MSKSGMTVMRLVNILVSGFIAALWTSSSWAIDCAKASNDTEVAICADSKLMASNDALERAYSQARKRLVKSDFAALRTAQRAWIALRADQCAGNVTCLNDMTRARTAKIYESLRLSNIAITTIEEPAPLAEEPSTEPSKQLALLAKPSKPANEFQEIRTSVMSSLVLIVVTDKATEGIKTFSGVTVATNTVALNCQNFADIDGAAVWYGGNLYEIRDVVSINKTGLCSLLVDTFPGTPAQVSSGTKQQLGAPIYVVAVNAKNEFAAKVGRIMGHQLIEGFSTPLIVSDLKESNPDGGVALDTQGHVIGISLGDEHENMILPLGLLEEGRRHKAF